MASDWAKELLADVARELLNRSTVEYTDTLERRLLGLLEAGEAMRDELDDFGDPYAKQCQADWDAAKAVASEGKAR